jgi:hypothetical protein
LCQPSSSSQAVTRNFRGGAMVNASSSNQWWVCPIAKSTPPSGLPSAYIVVSLNISCELFSRTSTTILLDVNSHDSTFIEDGFQILMYTRSIADSGNDDYYIFRCLVPPGSGVASYGYPAPFIVDEP